MTDFILYFSLFLTLIFPFYLVGRMNTGRGAKILCSAILLQALIVCFAFAWTRLTRERENPEWHAAATVLTRALSGRTDPNDLYFTLRYWLNIPEEKESGPDELAYYIRKLLPKTPDPRSASLELEPDETYKFDRPVPKPFPMPGNAVDYLNIPNYRTRVHFCYSRYLSSPEWHKKGAIVTGKIRLENEKEGAGVAAKTTFLQDGVFVQALHPGCELRFVRHGFDLLGIYLPPNSKMDGKIIDFGELTLRKTPSSALSEISFRLKLPGGVSHATAILMTGELPSPFPSESGEAFAPGRRDIAVRTVRNGAKIVFRGLSRIPYELRISAPDCVLKEKYFFGGRKNISFGTIELERVRKLRIHLRNGADSSAEWKKKEFEPDGERRLPLGNGLSLLIVPDRKNPERFLTKFDWNDCVTIDYGKTSLDDFIVGEESFLRRKDFRIWLNNAFLQAGHMHRFISKKKKTDVLIYLDPSTVPSSSTR